MSTPTATVIGLDFSDLGADGEQDPLGAAIVELVCSAARLKQDPQQLVGATVALGALRGAVTELPEVATFVGRVLDLVAVVDHETKEVSHG